MPSIGLISNGESGLSVRTKLNEVIDYVNTGITQDDKYITGATYNNSTGTLTLERQNGSINVTGFTTGFTETQSLENVLLLGNITNGSNIVMSSGDTLLGDAILKLSGNTGVEIDYYGGSFDEELVMDSSGINLQLTNNTLESKLNYNGSSVFLQSTDNTSSSTGQWLVNSTSIAGNMTDVSNFPNNISTFNQDLNQIYSQIANATLTSDITLDPFGNTSGTRIYTESIGSGANSKITQEYTNSTITTDNAGGLVHSVIVGQGSVETTATDGTISALVSVASTTISRVISDGSTTFAGSIDTIHDTALGNNKIQHNITTSNLTGITSTSMLFETDVNTDTSSIVMSIVGNGNTSMSIEDEKITIDTILLNLPNIPAYDDDAAAGTAGLLVGDVYQTTGNGAAPLDAAGIVMIKQ